MTVLAPRSIEDACAALALDGARLVLAGGTDLMVAVNAGLTRPTDVVAIDRIDELRSWDIDGDQLTLGAGLTYTSLTRTPLSTLVPALAQAARTVGSPQIRNAGTLGGNLATASPAGDTLPVLAALDAVVLLRSSLARRELPMSEFMTGPKTTALAAGELIVGVRVPVIDGPQEFLKVGTRNAMVISVASVAAIADPALRAVRIGLGSVGPTVLRAPTAEAWVAGEIDWDGSALPDPRTATAFGEMVATAALPIDDHRATAAYRRHCIAVLARRALLRMFPR